MKIKKERFKKLDYVLAFPDGYKEGVRYPVLFDTHGAGGRGTDINALDTTVLIDRNPCRESFVIVMPQCYADTWFEIFEQLIEFCEHIYNMPFTDKSCFYCSGTSMGGYTAYQLMMSRPELFAAGLVCCGGGMYWNAGRLKKIPLRIFHGGKDDVVYPRESEIMAERINAWGGNATLKIYPELGHNCWDATFSDPDNYEFLLSNKKA